MKNNLNNLNKVKLTSLLLLLISQTKSCRFGCSHADLLHSIINGISNDKISEVCIPRIEELKKFAHFIFAQGRIDSGFNPLAGKPKEECLELLDYFSEPRSEAEKLIEKCLADDTVKGRDIIVLNDMILTVTDPRIQVAALYYKFSRSLFCVECVEEGAAEEENGDWKPNSPRSETPSSTALGGLSPSTNADSPGRAQELIVGLLQVSGAQSPVASKAAFTVAQAGNPRPESKNSSRVAATENTENNLKLVVQQEVPTYTSSEQGKEITSLNLVQVLKSSKTTDSYKEISESIQKFEIEPSSKNELRTLCRDFLHNKLYCGIEDENHKEQKELIEKIKNILKEYLTKAVAVDEQGEDSKQASQSSIEQSRLLEAMDRIEKALGGIVAGNERTRDALAQANEDLVKASSQARKAHNSDLKLAVEALEKGAKELSTEIDRTNKTYENLEQRVNAAHESLGQSRANFDAMKGSGLPLNLPSPEFPTPSQSTVVIDSLAYMPGFLGRQQDLEVLQPYEQAGNAGFSAFANPKESSSKSMFEAVKTVEEGLGAFLGQIAAVADFRESALPVLDEMERTLEGSTSQTHEQSQNSDQQTIVGLKQTLLDAVNTLRIAEVPHEDFISLAEVTWFDAKAHIDLLRADMGEAIELLESGLENIVSCLNMSGISYPSFLSLNQEVRWFTTELRITQLCADIVEANKLLKNATEKQEEASRVSQRWFSWVWGSR
jgi:uncharacterized protein YukE